MHIFCDLDLRTWRRTNKDVYYGVHYQKRLRHVRDIVLRNLNCRDRINGELSISTFDGQRVITKRIIKLKQNMIVKLDELKDFPNTQELSATAITIELQSLGSESDESVVLCKWNISFDSLHFVGSNSLDSSSALKSVPTSAVSSFAFVGSSSFGQMTFPANALLVGFSEGYFCQNETYFLNEHVVTHTTPPAFRDVVFDGVSDAKYKILSGQHLSEMFSCMLNLVAQTEKNGEMEACLGRLVKSSSIRDEKRCRIERLKSAINMLTGEQMRISCENENIRMQNTKHEKQLISKDSLVYQLVQTVEAKQSKSTDLRHKISETSNQLFACLRSIQTLNAACISELREIFEITRTSSPVKHTSGARLSLNWLTKSSSVGGFKDEWHINGHTLPNSDKFEPDALEDVPVDDNAAITAINYVAWNLVVLSKLLQVNLRHPICITTYDRWYVTDHQTHLSDVGGTSRVFHLSLAKRGGNCKDDLRFTHALFCLNKNIGQLCVQYRVLKSRSLRRTLLNLNELHNKLVLHHRSAYESGSVNSLTASEQYRSYEDTGFFDGSSSIGLVNNSSSFLSRQESINSLSGSTFQSGSKSPNTDNLNNDLEAMFGSSDKSGPVNGTQVNDLLRPMRESSSFSHGRSLLTPTSSVSGRGLSGVASNPSISETVKWSVDEESSGEEEPDIAPVASGRASIISNSNSNNSLNSMDSSQPSVANAAGIPTTG